MKIELTEQDIQDIKEIRNYFGEHDKTLFEHKAYSVLDGIVKKWEPKTECKHENKMLNADWTKSVCIDCNKRFDIK